MIITGQKCLVFHFCIVFLFYLFTEMLVSVIISITVHSKEMRDFYEY